ncbi:MAG: hypothetical protein Q4P06_07980 [Actinomycetaceae bacterium]|nr:hypothetical protein [Actinomycetaceae bacterium]
MSAKTFLRNHRKPLILIAIALTVAVAITAAIVLNHRSQALAQARSECDQALVTLTQTSADTQELITDTELISEVTTEREALKTLTDKAHMQCEGTAKEIKQATKQIQSLTGQLKTTYTDLSKKAQTVLEQAHASALDDVKTALQLATDTYTSSNGKVDAAITDPLKTAIDQANNEITHASAATISQYLQAIDKLKDLHQTLTTRTTATSKARQAYVTAQTREQAPPANTDTGSEYAGEYTETDQWNRIPDDYNPPQPAPEPAPPAPADNGGWVVTEEEDECWLGDTSGNPAVPIPCDP